MRQPFGGRCAAIHLDWRGELVAEEGAVALHRSEDFIRGSARHNGEVKGREAAAAGDFFINSVQPWIELAVRSKTYK